VILREPLLADQHPHRPLRWVVSMGGAVTAPVRKVVGQEPVDAAESAASVRVGIGSYDAAGSLGCGS